MKRSTLQQHKEAMMLPKEGMIIAKTRSAFSIPHNTKHATPQNNIRKTIKYCTNYGMINHNVETCKKKKE
jgi:hypothetical protein